MPRKARESSQSCYHHIIVQGINKEYIFKREEDIEKYKEIIKIKLDKCKIEILAYCIMNNHAHFLIFSERNEDLSKYMQRVNTSYSQYYNKSNKRVGYVFRDRYYSQDILNENQLYNCLNYIHNNPVKAKIVKKVEDYKYSSYNEFMIRQEIVTNEGIKLLFGTVSKYKEEFVRIQEKDNLEEEQFYDVKEKSIDEFIKEIEMEYGRNIEELSKNKELLKNIANKARQETEVTIIELAKIMKVSKSSIGNYIKK